jgi:hypothetical protein
VNGVDGFGEFFKLIIYYSTVTHPKNPQPLIVNFLYYKAMVNNVKITNFNLEIF